MIDEIHLSNVALIREASMQPHPRFTVLTGETGSGKTAFLQGLKLLLGDRASADMVRSGQDELVVEGRFFAKDGPEDGVVASRSVSADGRSRVRIDGAMASVAALAEAVGADVDLCGQHEHQRLSRPSAHGEILDEWIGEELSGLLSRYRECLGAARQAQQRVDELLRMGAETDARIEEARFVKRRIDEVSPQLGEYEELLAESQRLENMEELLQAAGGAREALSGDEGALDALNAALSAVGQAARFDKRYAEQEHVLQEASYLLEDAARAIDELAPEMDSLDPRRIDELQTRLAGFQSLMRAYGPSMDEVFARLADAEAALESVDRHDELLAEAQQRLGQAERELADAADALSALRHERAPRFAKDVATWLARLEMPEGAILCEVQDLPRERWGEQGPNQVVFLFRPGAGMEPRALSRIASGGEMSRVTLAIKAVIGSTDRVETLVFDEVDAGIGGKTALAVADALANLAETHQLIVVTHLAQIAVMADAHYVVEKLGSDHPETRMRQVDGRERVEEVARMLSGGTDPSALVHAEGLLREASSR